MKTTLRTITTIVMLALLLMLIVGTAEKLGERLHRADYPERPMPRLIGHGCDGAGGDVWAMDESDFPTSCQIIEEY